MCIHQCCLQKFTSGHLQLHTPIFQHAYQLSSLKSFPVFKVVQFSSVAQLCLTLCDPMNRSTPGLPVHYQLPESTQTHVHWVGDAIQPSPPLSSPSPPAFNLSQYQGSFQMSQLFVSGGQSIGVSASTSVLPMNTQDWSPLGWTGWMWYWPNFRNSIT